MSAIEPEPSDDLTPEQRRQQIIAILARAVTRRVRWLRMSPPLIGGGEHTPKDG